MPNFPENKQMNNFLHIFFQHPLYLRKKGKKIGGLIHSACELIVARPLLICLPEKKQNQALVNLTKIGHHFVSDLFYNYYARIFFFFCFSSYLRLYKHNAPET